METVVHVKIAGLVVGDSEHRGGVLILVVIIAIVAAVAIDNTTAVKGEIADEIHNERHVALQVIT
jgi:hypothetical protein